MNPLSPQARRLLELVHAAGAPENAVLARVERRLAERVASGVGLATAGTLVTKVATGTSVLASAAKIGVVAIVVGTMGAGGWYAVRSARHLEPARPAASVSASLDSSRSRSPAELPLPNAVPEASAQTDSVASSRVPAASLRSPKVTASSAASNAAEILDPLTAETRDLRRAQQALRNGDPVGAMRLLDQQDLTYKNGALQQERAAARVLALCQSKPKGTATAEVERFERRWPKSPLVARLRSSCGQQ